MTDEHATVWCLHSLYHNLINDSGIVAIRLANHMLNYDSTI